MHRNAIAICNGAHLSRLKAFDTRMHDLATQRLPDDLGLRTVTTSELLQADKKLWGELAALHTAGWSLDDALHELTNIRSDLHCLLQPRAKPPPALKKPDLKGNKGNKGEGKGGKGGGKVRKEQLKADGALPKLDLVTAYQGKTLCVRWNKGMCTNKQCKYTHGICAFKMPTGQPCGKNHPACKHKPEQPST